MVRSATRTSVGVRSIRASAAPARNPVHVPSWSKRQARSSVGTMPFSAGLAASSSAWAMVVTSTALWREAASSASAFLTPCEPLRSATATSLTPESRRLSAWAWPWLP